MKTKYDWSKSDWSRYVHITQGAKKREVIVDWNDNVPLPDIGERMGRRNGKQCARDMERRGKQRRKQRIRGRYSIESSPLPFYDEFKR